MVQASQPQVYDMPANQITASAEGLLWGWLGPNTGMNYVMLIMPVPAVP